MGLPTDASPMQLVIKHTFLEYVDDNKVTSDDSLKRQRSQTEPAIFQAKPCYGEVRELLHGDSSSSSSHIGDTSSTGDLDSCQIEPMHTEPSVLVLQTPESTPLHCPVARQVPGWLQDEWADGLLPEAYAAPQAVDAWNCSWNEQYAIGEWWTPGQFALGQTLPGDRYDLSSTMNCNQYQAAQYPAEQHQAEQYQAGAALECPSLEQVYPPVPINACSIDTSCPKAPAAAVVNIPTRLLANDETRTTVMLRDLPEAYSRTMLLELLKTQGFFGRVDFLYLPVDFKHRRNLGYALINLVSPSEALRFISRFEGFSSWGVASERTGSVGWCSPQQGLEAHVERYRNSPVMHVSVPEEWRPLLLSHGVPIAFPPPTVKIKAPKVKGRQV